MASTKAQAVSPITLEDLKLEPSSKPLALIFSGKVNYKGYGRQIAACHLDAYVGPDRKVFIATEIDTNPGCSITNGIEMVADAVEEQFSLGHVFGPTSDRTNVLVEHYDNRSYSSHPDRDDYSIMEFKGENGSYKYYSNPGWWGVEKSEIERLIGGQLV